ncbi:MAG: hypothetical protein OEX19_00930, partial [Gammaproteobacteria bacterium]|nr:hypothetical protein [Gammaproteobacteria bacterium]
MGNDINQYCDFCHSTSEWVPALRGLDYIKPLSHADWSNACGACHLPSSEVVSEAPEFHQTLGLDGECGDCHNANNSNVSFPSYNNNRDYFAPYVVAVGATKLQVSVSNKGAANISLSISKAPGINSLAPDVSLDYDSNTPNGLFGVGWQLNGLSRIARCRPTLAQDNLVDNVDYDENDRFCLDGERLIEIENKTFPGTCEVGDSINKQYITETNKYSRIISCGTQGFGPKYFRAWSKSGNLFEYGTSNDSKIESNNRFGIDTQTNTDSVIIWSLKRVSDQKSNHFYISYSKTINLGPETANPPYTPVVHHYPESINYSGNKNTNLSTSRSINFEYTNRFDIENSYVAQVKLEVPKRISKIVTKINGRTVREYRFRYEYSSATQRSILSEILECAQDTSNITCFNPTKFDWQDNQNALQTPVAIPDFTGRNIKYTSAGDFNGDGIGDLFYPYGGSWRVLFGKNNVDGSLSFSTEVNTGIGYGSDEEKYSAVLDYNANGISDFLVPGSTQDGYSNWIVISYDNNQFVKTNTGISSGAYTLGFGVADINADGYDDLIYSELDISNSHQYLSLLRNSANGFSVGSNIHYATQPGGSANTRIEGRPEILRWSPIDLILVGMGKIDRELDKGKTIGSSSMDFNGDGRADLVVNDIVTNTCDLFLSQAQNNNSDFLWVGSLGKCDDILPMDINGDQITDWLTTGARTGMFSAGVGISVPLVGMTNSATTKYMIPVDLNLDGKTDYIFPDQGQFTYRLSNGTRFRSVNSGVPAYISSSCLKEGETYCYAENTRTVDINGDGFYDIVTQSGNSWYVYENRVSGVNNTIDKIVGINHGLGNTATFTYDSTAIIEDYQPSSVEPNYPIVEYRAPNKVVTRLSTDLFVNNYYYQGSKYDRLRRQYLGFEKQTTKSESTQIFNERSFYQEYPLTGLQKHFDSFYYKDPSDLTTKVLLTSNNSTIASNKATVANQSYYDVYTTQSVEKNYDLDGVLQSTKTIEYQDIDGNNTPLDAYGNVEKIQITLEAGGIFNDKFIETKEFLYTPIITNDVWLTGLMSRSSSVTKNKDNVQSNPRSIGFTYYSSGSSHYGMLHCKTQQPDDPLLRLKTCFTYDDYGNILTTELEGFDGQYDENGVAINTTVLTKRIAKAEYTNGSINANLQTVAMTEDFGVGRKNLLTTHTIDARFGESTSIEDENGLTTRIQFDSFGRVKIETRVNDSYVETELNTNCTLCSTDLPYSQRKTEYSPSNEVIRSELTIYDKLLRPRITRTVGFDGTQICQSKQYYEAGHEKGRLKKESIPYDCETDTEDTVAAQYYEYDLLGRLIKVTKPDGTVAITNYAGITPDGFLSTVSRERKGYNGNTTVSTTTLTEKTYKNVKDWIIKVTDHDNSSNLYQHDPVGNIQHVIVANQERYTVSTLYDALGRKQTLSDPNLGTRLFRYNAFGDLIWQKDNNDNGTITKIKYDTLGRQIEREYFQIRENETAYTSTLKETWQYDTSVNGLGELASTSNTNGFNAVYTYEAEHGNVETVTKTLNGNEYTLTYQYDENGREEYIVYPQSSSHSALIVHKQYKADFLETICQVVNTTDTCNSVNSKLIWQANNYTFDGKIGNETRGRIATNFAYSENTGFLEGIHGQLDTTTVLDHSFEYDSLGNLESRTDSKLIWWDSDNHNAQQQKFSYDNLNRLSNVKINNQIYRSYEYDEVGNVTYRSDVGYYSYGQGNAGPNAVTSIGSVSNPQSIVANPVPGDANADGMITGIDIVYATNHLLGIKDAIGNPKCKNGTEVTIEDLSCITSHVDFQGAQQGVAYYYDNNGNLTYSNGRHLRYTPYNKPSLIKKEGTSVSFSYDSDHNRYQKNVDKQGDISKVLYFGKLFELYVSSDGTEQTKNYVHVNGQTVALINHDNVASFMHTDHLGSVVAITNEGGSILARYAYDPFGARVNAKWDDYETTSGSQNSITNRSFTQHEYLDDLGFIHMNGRVFDPAVGRFVSADPYIQFVYSSQGFNRYTYVSNNPLSYTDPTGYKVCPRSPTECTWAAIEIVVGGALIAAGYITPCSIVCYSIGTFLFIDGNDRFFNNPSYWETFWGDVGFEVGGEINTDGTGGSLEVSATSNSGGIRNNKFTIVKWEFYFGNY